MRSATRRRPTRPGPPCLAGPTTEICNVLTTRRDCDTSTKSPRPSPPSGGTHKPRPSQPKNIAHVVVWVYSGTMAAFACAPGLVPSVRPRSCEMPRTTDCGRNRILHFKTCIVIAYALSHTASTQTGVTHGSSFVRESLVDPTQSGPFYRRPYFRTVV